jgi:hypothetical protein
LPYLSELTDFQVSIRHLGNDVLPLDPDTYTQALTPAKREAATKIVRMILPQPIQTAVAGGEK